MDLSIQCLSASEAAKRLGVSIKALRLYERQRLVTLQRTAAGYRAYGPNDMARAAEVVTLRALGLSLAEVARVLAGDHRNLATALAAHEAILEQEIRHLVCKIDKARGLRADIARDQMPSQGELTRLLYSELSVAFELPWPWGGEPFELRDIRTLNYITGPLGSGKTRLALRLSEAFPNAAFLGLDRLNDAGAATAARLSYYARSIEYLPSPARHSGRTPFIFTDALCATSDDSRALHGGVLLHVGEPARRQRF
jgi:DNA-binding transcriptional MerR regulator